MDRFRKCIGAVRSGLREFVNRNWHNQPERDAFRLFDVVMLIGGVRSWTLTKNWQRISWKMYRMLALFHYTVFILNLIDHVFYESDFGDMLWHTSVFVSGSMCFVQHFILNRFIEPIQIARDFINGKPADSGDKFYDAILRKKFFRCAQTVAGIILLIASADELVVAFHKAGIAELFGTPRLIRSLGPRVATVSQFMFTAVLWSLWFCKRLAGTGLVYSVLFAFQMEFEIFARGFGQVWDCVQLEVEENMPASSTTSTAAEDQPAQLLKLRRLQREQLFWKYLDQHVTNHAMKHVELVENLRSLKSAISWFFFALYYYSLLLVSPLIFIVLLKGLSEATIALTFGIGCFFLECYLWCNQIEAFQDINEKLEIRIMELVTMLPYSKEHHAEYIEMRKTLMIIKMNVRCSCQFTCGGVFTITVEVVSELLNISYSVFTFLRDVGKVNTH